MSPDSKEAGSNASDISDLRLPDGVPPTKSYLRHKDWLIHIKKVMEVVRPNSEEPVGPFFRENAPYRAKITPPHERGTVLLIKGHVWEHDSKRPAGGAKMDVWQADSDGHYDNEGPDQASEGPFVNRARVYCDRNGYYEFETIHPGPYQRDGIWRAPHIHFRVIYTGYRTLVTQLFFSGDPHLNEDPFREESLIIPLKQMGRNDFGYEEGVFDIVLSPETQ